MSRVACAAVLVLAAAAVGARAESSVERPVLAGSVAVSTRAGIVVLDDARRRLLDGTRPGDADAAWSPDARRLVVSRRFGNDRELVVLDTWSGEATRITDEPQALDVSPAWSPDGTRIAWARGIPGRFDVWLARADGSRPRPLAAGPASELDPAWSPDSARVAFASDEAGEFDVLSAPAGGGAPEPAVVLPGDERRPAWSPDGRLLAFVAVTPDGGDLYVAPPGGTPQRLTSEPGLEGRPAWFPDGVTLAYERLTPGRRVVWATRVDARARWPLRRTRAGDGAPAWGAAFPPAGAAAGPRELLPDLDQRAPAGIVVDVVRGRVLLGFDSAVDNVGSGALRIVGRRADLRSGAMAADQVIPLTNGGRRVAVDVGVLRYERHAPHRHWHLEPFERYELRRVADHALVARDRKAGFCLTDRYGHAARRVSVPVRPRFVGDCAAGDPDAVAVVQGSSPGFTDRYPAWFHGQAIDVTDVPTGTYVLVHRANPELSLHETRYDNNAASVLVRLQQEPAPSARVLAACPQRERCSLRPARTLAGWNASTSSSSAPDPPARRRPFGWPARAPASSSAIGPAFRVTSPAAAG